ncbi:helix-turn-helix domain-containing protein [Vagococcus fluvialis]|uniref:helix-turn-helix domain-containing protein n=1 Tax=Vagococcus fluvialis TaxID=2738 RepID=UPI003D0ED579
MKNKTNYLVPYDLIEKALDGDPEVISQITAHYRPYFSRMALRLTKNEFGETRAVVDEILQGRLEIKLLTTILNFKIRK